MLNSFPWANCHGKAGNMVTDVKSYGNTRGLRTDRAVTVTRDTVTEHWHTIMPVLSHGGLAGGPPGPDRDTLITGMKTVTGLCRRDCQAGTAKDSDDDHRVLSINSDITHNITQYYMEIYSIFLNH
jgi:hypothetical protein